MDSFFLIHQPLFSKPCGLAAHLFVSSINSCFVHHLVWTVLHWSHPPAGASSIIWYGFFFSRIHQMLLCAPSGVSSSSLFSDINSCFVHHLEWIPSYFSFIKSCFVHQLVWVVLHWSHPSLVVSYMIWYGFLHQFRPLTVIFYIIR